MSKDAKRGKISSSRPRGRKSEIMKGGDKDLYLRPGCSLTESNAL